MHRDLDQLLRRYVERLERRGPFPPESMVAWAWLLEGQRAAGITGHVLEIGVEFGTSAFLLLETLGPHESATLVDLRQTDEVRHALSGPYSAVADRVRFLEASSRDVALPLEPRSCRWVHIDGDHTYDSVAFDLHLSEPLLSDEGILVFDDFFEVRWPDVAVAVLDGLRRTPSLVPALLVDRKLYCVRPQYAATFRAHLETRLDVLRAFGTVRHWAAVPFLGHDVTVLKIAPTPGLIAPPKRSA